jgi:predicted DNA-binding transcriptional regulator AlpA
MEHEEPDYITIEDACRIVGGTKPIDPSTYYRGVKAGRFPKPERILPQTVRIRRGKLLACLNRLVEGASDERVAQMFSRASCRRCVPDDVG